MSKLEELTIDEVSLVDEGANPEAHIVLFKRKEENKMEEETKTVEKNVVIDVEKAELQKRVAELEKKLAEREAAEKSEVEKAAAGNAELVAALERVNKRMEEHLEKAEDAELMKVASKYEILGEKADDTFKLLKSLKGTEDYDLLIGAFDKALAQVEKSGMFEEIGKNGHGAGSVEELAKKFQAEDKTLTARQARDKAFVTLGIYE